LGHGFFHELLHMEPPLEFIFLPHFKAVPALDHHTSSQVCPFVQGETFYLQATFREKLAELKSKGTKILTPLLDLTQGLESAQEALISTAIQMKVSRASAKQAFSKALVKQQRCFNEMIEIGKNAIEQLQTDPSRMAVVLFARAYNGFVDEAHMGIPHKLASRGILVIPYDFLMFDGYKTKRHMYWGIGQRILKAARLVQKHSQLFGTFITNFSCGPDSFLIGYFRDIMQRKPSLTLELDNHTADAGLETRIEAFLDIVSAYRQLVAKKQIVFTKKHFVPARTLLDNSVAKVITSSGEVLPVSDPRVTLLTPSMGDTSSESLAAVFRGFGFNAAAHPPSCEAVLKMGRANTSCKECLPLILTTGTLLNYINNGRKDGEVLIYFMPTGNGPCRFGQYHIFMEDLVKRHRIENVAVLSLTSENAYAGLGNEFVRRVWWGVIVSDAMEDIRSMILANAVDPESGIQIFDREWSLLIAALEKGDLSRLEKQCANAAGVFARIPMKSPPREVPTISLIGEIFVRRDALSRQYLTERLAEKGFATICAPIAEWILYTDYLVDKGLVDYKMSKREKLQFLLRKKFMRRYEKRLKSILSRSGLVHAKPLDLNSIIANAAPYISPMMTGEAILTIGSALAEVASHSCGVIAIGPFGCMPNRVAEAILNETMNREAKLALDPKNKQLRSALKNVEDLPFLAIESDGSPFPQLINAKLETFCLRAERLHHSMLAAGVTGRAN
jgi:predicted nucleotide-binding protein (sugar kinase/HSP70/actin superfamily)